jgi:hypothetical protein
MALGLQHYFNGKPCPHGHIDRRYTLNGRCMECSRASSSKFTKDNPEKNRARVLKYRIADPDKFRARYQANRKRADPFQRMVNQKRATCKHLGVPFDLDAEYLKGLMPDDGLCPIFRTRMILYTEDGPTDERLSIDRKDPSLGYLKGNVQLLSFRANRAKNDITDPVIFDRLASFMRAS